MLLIDQKASVWGAVPDSYDESISWIARAARRCYRAEPKTDDETFVKKRLIPDPPHSSIIEHSNFAVQQRMRVDEFLSFTNRHGLNTRWLTRRHLGNSCYCIFGNLRAWMEGLGVKHPADVYAWADLTGMAIMPTASLPEEMVRVTAEFITDRAVLAEITRHRDDVGFSVESQRYVDYSGEVLYVKPSWHEQASQEQQQDFYEACLDNEAKYVKARKTGLSPQHARVYLNNQARTVIVMTAYLPEWRWVFKLRRAGAAYPQMVRLMDDAWLQFQGLGLL